MVQVAQVAEVAQVKAAVRVKVKAAGSVAEVERVDLAVAQVAEVAKAFEMRVGAGWIRTRVAGTRQSSSPRMLWDTGS